MEIKDMFPDASRRASCPFYVHSMYTVDLVQDHAVLVVVVGFLFHCTKDGKFLIGFTGSMASDIYM